MSEEKTDKKSSAENFQKPVPEKSCQRFGKKQIEKNFFLKNFQYKIIEKKLSKKNC